MKSTILALALFSLTAVFPMLSRADSDGYSCASKGYLAYELREGLTPGVVGHVLRVVRFEPERGVYVAGEVSLPDFQVQGMTCSQDRVEILGWPKVFTKYIIETIGPQGVRILETTEDRQRQFDYRTAGPQPPNLARWAKPVRLDLESSDADHRYELIVTSSLRQVAEGWEQHHKAEIDQIEPGGGSSQRVVLFEIREVVEGGD